MNIRTALLLMSISLPLFGAYTASDYNEAMRMAVKFFGGQRCGNTHNWMLVESTDPKTTDSCHTKDACNGKPVTGGWHDCGDRRPLPVLIRWKSVAVSSAQPLIIPTL